MGAVAKKVNQYVQKFIEETEEPGDLGVPTKSEIDEYILYDLFDGNALDEIGGVPAVFAWVYEENPNAGFVSSAIETWAKQRRHWTRLEIEVDEVVAALVIVAYVHNELYHRKRGWA